MSVAMSRHLTLETVQVEQWLTVDGQGKPTYDTPVDIEARITRQDRVVLGAEGSYVQKELALWVPPDAAVLPNEHDRLTYGGEVFYVLQVKDIKDRNAQLVHRRLRSTPRVQG